MDNITTAMDHHPGNEWMGDTDILICRIIPGNESTAQSPFQELSSSHSSQKTHKSRYQTILVLSSFTGFLYFVPNILSWIVVAYNFSLLICRSFVKS